MSSCILSVISLINSSAIPFETSSVIILRISATHDIFLVMLIRINAATPSAIPLELTSKGGLLIASAFLLNISQTILLETSLAIRVIRHFFKR